MALEIVTGYTGKPHITSQQDAILNAASLGTGGRHILNVGNQFGYELESNTLIRINDGYAINQGRLMGMSSGDYEEVEISAGISGTKRSDLVVIHYEKDASTGIESAELRVIEGTAGEEYADSEYLGNDLINGSYTSDDLLLYRININGLSIDSVESLFTVWYLDTGWREDWVTQDKSPVSTGVDTNVTPAIRVIGNMVHLKGCQYMSLTTDVNFAIPQELAPQENIAWKETDVSAVPDEVYVKSYTMDKSGNLRVCSSLSGSYPCFVFINKSWLLY